MTHKNKEFFEELAVPHSWFLVAVELHEQSAIIYSKRGTSQIRHQGSSNSPYSYDLSNRSSFLLAGLSLENFIKGHLVYENPSWISNGHLSKELRSHSLTTLAGKSSALPWQKKGHPTLVALESGINSWARYPCPLSIDNFSDTLCFNERLWENYLKLTNRYKESLISLMQKKWKGPHSELRHYTFSGGF